MGVDQGQRPFFKLVILAPRGKVFRARQVLRRAVGEELDIREGRAQTLFDQADGKMGDVDADPTTPKFLGGMDGGAAAAERVKHHIAGVGRGVEDAFKERDGLLGGVAEAFFGLEKRREVPDRNASDLRFGECKGPAEAGPRDADKI